MRTINVALPSHAVIVRENRTERKKNTNIQGGTERLDATTSSGKTHTHTHTKRTNVYGRRENRARTAMTIDKGKTGCIQTSKSCSNYSAGNYGSAVDAGQDEYTILHPYDGSINTTREILSGCTHIRLLEAAAHLHVLCYNLV